MLEIEHLAKRTITIFFQMHDPLHILEHQTPWIKKRFAHQGEETFKLLSHKKSVTP